MGFSEDSQIVVLDDSVEVSSNLSRWLGREVRPFTHLEDFLNWQGKLDKGFSENLTVFMDQNLANDKQRGTEILAKYGQQHRTIMVTDDFFDSDVVDTCGKLGVPVLPKPVFMHSN